MQAISSIFVVSYFLNTSVIMSVCVCVCVCVCVSTTHVGEQNHMSATQMLYVTHTQPEIEGEEIICTPGSGHAPTFQ